MLNKHFVLHLSLIENIGPATIQQIVEYIRSGAQASDLYCFSAFDWMQHCGITEKKAHLLALGLSNTKLLETELALIDEYNISWATVEEEHYPALLKTIYMPPAVLYWQGGTFDYKYKHCAVVGARASNAYGRRILTTMVSELVSAGITIVSGGALGIDTIAHDTAIKNGGKTIVVLGSGLLRQYPLSNVSLFKRIIETDSLMVSAFPLTMEALPGNFPARNRIISGLSHGCFVVQAAQKSGALITAHYAVEQGRDVFALPGAVDDELSQGCHGLIQHGAKLVTCAQDIIQEYGMRHSVGRDIQITLHDAQQLMNKEKSVYIDQRDNQGTYSDVQKKILNACYKPASLDDIIQATELELSTIQSELFSLQIDGKVQQDFIGMWQAT